MPKIFIRRKKFLGISIDMEIEKYLSMIFHIILYLILEHCAKCDGVVLVEELIQCDRRKVYLITKTDR